jgi:glycosyltransferase involved in cell wall biosynthesis
MKPRLVSILVPCYNEAAHVAEVIAKVRAADVCGLEREIVAVDDGSTDGTLAALRGIGGIKVLEHARNRGKGAALRTALEAATGDVVLIQDGDLEYDPADYPGVLRPIIEGRADVVLGSRFARERPHFFFGPRVSPFFTHYIGNLTIVALTNLLYGTKLTDCEGAYKVFRRETARALKLESEGFEFDNELLCKLLRKGGRVVEAPITYAPRTYQEGKKIRWEDGVYMCWTIVKWRVMPF